MQQRSLPLSWVVIAVGAAAFLYLRTGDQPAKPSGELAFWSEAERKGAAAAGFTDAKTWRLEKIARAQAEATAESQRPPQNVTLPQGSTSAGNCRQDLSCIGDKLALAASVRCKPDIERRAEFTHEWTDGLLEPKFSRYRWTGSMGGAVTVIGDKIRFQNGFGAWQNMVYECDMDPQSQKPLAVRVRPGRL